ncbi:hypothetical protein [Nonomuraea sp. JJY05]|uniref:hypothetical protein n=1 Tax=Nonomuraea sp. JJY05 TaxID=3350255 RepID=UPI00373F32B3
MTKAREFDRDILGDVLFLGIGAVVLWVSFDTLTHLAELAGWSTVWELPNGWKIRMAWALPVAVDFYAIATARAWLMRRWWITQATRDHARAGAWWAIGGSVALNSISHALTMLRYHAESFHGVVLAVLIGAVPPVVLAAIAHLRALQNQDRAEAADRDRTRAERIAEQQARRAEAKAGTGRPDARPKPGTGAVPAPLGAGTASGAGTAPGSTLVPPRPRPPRPAPAPRSQQEQQPDPGKTTLLTAKDLDFAEQFMADNPGRTPTKQDLMDCGLGSGRALRIRAYIETANAAGPAGTAAQPSTSGPGPDSGKPVPADAGTAANPLPGTDPAGTEADSPAAGTESADAGTNAAVNE